MKVIPAALKTWLNAGNNASIRADLLTVTLADGSVYRWTTWLGNLVVSGQTYLAGGDGTAPVVERGAFSQNAKLTIDTLDLSLNGKGFTIGGLVIPALAAKGFFDFARVQLDHLIMPTPGDVSLGPILSFFEGGVAGVDPEGSKVSLRLKSELAALNVFLPKFLAQAGCGNVVYDTNCALVKASFTDSGTATGGTTTTVTTATAAITGKAANYYVLGVVKFTSGALNGTRRAVSISSSGTITLALPLPSAPQAGDTFTVFPGCDRTKPTCQTKFSNLVHFRGYPHIPKSEAGS